MRNTALYQTAARATPVLGPSVSGPVSGNRGSLDGQANAFGRIEVTGTLGGAGTTTGKISWTDNADMDFGGVTIGARQSCLQASRRIWRRRSDPSRSRRQPEPPPTSPFPD